MIILQILLSILIAKTLIKHILLLGLIITLAMILGNITFKDKSFNPPLVTENKITPIEQKMYHALLKAVYKPMPQFKVKPYRLDFAIIHNGIKLDIECDGKDYHSTPKQKAHDRKRTRYLKNKGWEVIRFSGRQIYKDIDRCIARINAKLNSKSP